MENNNNLQALEWDSTIENEGTDFILLPEGEYTFTVKGFNRSYHNGSEKLPPCNKAELDIAIDSPEGTVHIMHNLFLHQKTEGLLSAFFLCIGQKKHGEPLRMNWNAVIGAKGRCKVGVRDWTSKDGKPRQSNQIERFLDPKDDDLPFTMSDNNSIYNQPAAVSPSNEQPAQTKMFVPGQF